MVSSVYLRLLIFLLAMLIPACASSSPAFLMMYSAYKLNRQGDNTQLWHTPFPIWNQSVVPCPVLTIASWSAYRFIKRQVKWNRLKKKKKDQISEIYTDTNRFIFCICHICTWAFMNLIGIPVKHHFMRLVQNSYSYVQMAPSFFYLNVQIQCFYPLL